MNLQILLLFKIVVIAKVITAENKPIPVLMWHGMGDSCCFPFSLGSIKKLLESQITDIYVNSVEIGGNLIEDYESGFFIHPNKQVAKVCELILNDPKLVNGYNAIGFSQGGQFLRAVAQRCPQPPMINLISLGGQHQGIFGLPNCPLSMKTCEYFRRLLNHSAYASWVQDFLVQATYWHDPLQEELYKTKSTFIAEINNELVKNQTYIDNLNKLNRFVMVKFTEDTIVEPKESQWFEFYESGQDKIITPFNESDIFINNKLGLQEMMTNGKLIFLESKGNHLQFTRKWFIDNIVPILSE